MHFQNSNGKPVFRTGITDMEKTYPFRAAKNPFHFVVKFVIAVLSDVSVNMFQKNGRKRATSY